MKYGLKQRVRIAASEEQGEVIARAESATAEPSYLLRYKCADGRAVDAWWAESALLLLQEDPVPRPEDVVVDEKEIQDTTDAWPTVTMQGIEDSIVSEHYFTAADGVYGAGNGVAEERPGCLSLLTFCVLVLRNGFTVTGESACVHPKNFNAEKGRVTARQHAVAKIWPLMGYELMGKLHRELLLDTVANDTKES